MFRSDIRGSDIKGPYQKFKIKGSIPKVRYQRIIIKGSISKGGQISKDYYQRFNGSNIKGSLSKVQYSKLQSPIVHD